MTKKANEKAKGKAKGKKKGARRHVQGQLPGTEDKRDPVLTKMSRSYAEVRDERMTLLRQEVERRDALLVKLRERGIESYRDQEAGIEITIVKGKDKVKVKSIRGDEEEEEINWGPASGTTSEPPADAATEATAAEDPAPNGAGGE